MTSENIKGRLKCLKESREAAMQELATLDQKQKQIFANINAFNGAIEECNYWINSLSSDTPEKPE